MTAYATEQIDKHRVEQMGAEIDALRDSIIAKLGDQDVKYIRKIMKLQKRLEVGGRVSLMFGLNPLMWLAGTTMLSFSKIIENMEIGHNVMHGQYDFSNDPKLIGINYEWDNVCIKESWQRTHNYEHHAYTNIAGKDRDLGYGVFRVSEHHPWGRHHLFQTIYVFWLAIFFEYGVALHGSRINLGNMGDKKYAEQVRQELKPTWEKIKKQVLKDYVYYPALAGPFFLPVIAGNATANLARNIWAFLVIACGHFTDDVAIYSMDETKNETKAQWYLRQIRGSSNITGGKLMHLMTGNLSYHIEHHLFPDLPSHRYKDLSPEIQRICKKYGQPYQSESFLTQTSAAIKRVIKFSFPTKTKSSAKPVEKVTKKKS